MAGESLRAIAVSLKATVRGKSAPGQRDLAVAAPRGIWCHQEL